MLPIQTGLERLNRLKDCTQVNSSYTLVQFENNLFAFSSPESTSLVQAVDTSSRPVELVF